MASLTGRLDFQEQDMQKIRERRERMRYLLVKFSLHFEKSYIFVANCVYFFKQILNIKFVF